MQPDLSDVVDMKRHIAEEIERETVSVFNGRINEAKSDKLWSVKL